MYGSVVLASGVDSSRLLPLLSVGALPGLKVAAGVAAMTGAPSRMANADAPESSCIGIGFASATNTLTLARSKPPMVPRLQARFCPL